MASSSAWDISYRCHICYSNYDDEFPVKPDADYRQKVVEICVDYVFSEITGDKFDWNLIMGNKALPFCHECWETIEKIYEFNLDKEPAENAIKEIVENLSLRILANRNYMRKRGFIESATSISMSNGGVKIEGGNVSQNIKCRLCHSMYVVGDANTNNQLSLDITVNIMNNCEKHLYPELIDEEFYDWNSIPFHNFVPFCPDCAQEMKKIMELNDKITEVEDTISSNVDIFTLKVLKRRKELKKSGKIKFHARVSTVELDDDDCQIIDITTNTNSESYEGTFTDSSQELSPNEEDNYSLLENSVNLKPAIVADFEDENTSVMPNDSIATTPDFPPESDPETMEVVQAELDTRPELAAVLRFPNEADTSENENCTPNTGRPRVTVARLPINSSGTLFKCLTCGKIFIFRKCWEAHALQCPKQNGNRNLPNPSALARYCCEIRFADNESWHEHLIWHRSQQSLQAVPMSDVGNFRGLATSSPEVRNLHTFLDTSSEMENNRAPIIPEARNVRSATPEEDFNWRSHTSSPEARFNRATVVTERRNDREAAAEDLQFQCDLCSKLCATARGAKLHRRLHTHQFAYKCRQCSRSFGYSSQLKAHYAKVHANETETPLKKAKSASHLPQNYKTPGTGVKVPKSKSQSKSQSTSRKKNGRSSTGKKRIFSCPFCPTPIDNKKHLIEHLQTHYSIAENKRCEICKLVFSRKSGLICHNRSFHAHN